MHEALRRPRLVVVPDSPAPAHSTWRALRSAETDADLARSAIAGDEGADAALYRRHADAVLALATRLLRSRDEAADVLQDTFVEALESMDSLRDPNAVRGWLFKIAVHQVHRRFRRRRLRNFLGMDTHDSGSFERIAGDDVSADVRTELALLDRALANTSHGDRIAWTLRRIEGHSLPEVAELCGCSLATAKRRIKAIDDRVASHVAPADRSECREEVRGA